MYEFFELKSEIVVFIFSIFNFFNIHEYTQQILILINVFVILI